MRCYTTNQVEDIIPHGADIIIKFNGRDPVPGKISMQGKYPPVLLHDDPSHTGYHHVSKMGFKYSWSILSVMHPDVEWVEYSGNDSYEIF